MDSSIAPSGKRCSRSDDVVLCCNINISSKNILSNRIYGFDPEWSWADIFSDLQGELDEDVSLGKNNSYEISVSSKLHGSEKFFPDKDESIRKTLAFDPSLKYITFDVLTQTETKQVDESNKLDAFNVLMKKSTVYDKKPKFRSTDSVRFTAKDRLYNDVVSQMVIKGALFPGSTDDNTISKHVATVVNALWYVDGSMDKLVTRLNNDLVVPKRFLLLYSGYNNWRAQKKKAPQLSAELLKLHSSSLFKVLMLPYTSKWGDFATDLRNLALCLDAYASFLEKSNTLQKDRQEMDGPVREVAKHSYLQHRQPVNLINNRYSLLDVAISKLDFYESLFFDEEHHLISQFKNTFERFDFLQNIALSEPIDILRYDPGGSIGATVFIWKTSHDRGTNEVMNSTLRVVEKLKPNLSEYHTRRMKRDFVKRYSALHSVDVPKHILRAIYAELSFDASCDQNPTLDARVKQAILADDPDLVLDLRHNNTGRPGDEFQPFFDLLRAKVEELCAADERRHNVEHLSNYVSVRDLIDDVRKDLPEDAKIPSESTVLFSFAPKNAYLKTSRLYKSKVPLQFKVQTRQLRASHQDDHFCAAQYKYMRQFAFKFRESVTFLSIDDKSKVDFGEPGQYVASGVRGKKSVVPSGSSLAALDHDIGSKGSLTPSVCLNINIPIEKDASFYQGKVHVTYKDSIFQPSSPWRHTAEIQGLLRDVNENDSVNPILLIFSDGGPDHRITYHSVKLSLILLFKNLDLDLLIAGRTAPGHSWLNPVERIMSILNIAMQNAALARTESNSEIEQVLRSANSMADIRKKAENVRDLKHAWMSSVEPVIQLLRGRTEKMILKGVPFKTHDPAPEELVKALERQVQAEIDPNISLGHYLQKDLGTKAEYQKFLKEHCLERQYVFQVRKCARPECCTPKRGPDVPWLPDPVLSPDNQHYKPFDEVLGQETTDRDRPSAKNTTAKAVAETLQGAKNSILTGQNVRRTIICGECLKPRCVYSTKALTMRESRTLTRQLERYDYSCGALIAPEGDILHGKVFIRLQMSCTSPVEYAYYSTTISVRKDICCICAAENAEKDKDLLKSYRVVLPICQSCKDAGKEPLKRNPIK